MDVTKQELPSAILLRVEDTRLDAAVAIQFKDCIRDMSKNAPERVLLDLSNVAFMDSSGLGALVGVMKQLSPARKLELIGLTGAVKKVFRLTRMESVFKIHETLPEAVGELDAE